MAPPRVPEDQPYLSEFEEVDPPGLPGAMSDETLSGHLVRRGSYPAPPGLVAAILGRLDPIRPVPRWRLALVASRPVAAAGFAVVVAVAVLLVATTAPRNSGQASPPTPASSLSTISSPSSTPILDGQVWDPTQRALTPPEFVQILRTHPPAGTVLIVDDKVVQSSVSCAMAEHCPTGTLENTLGAPVEPPVGGRLPFSSDASSIVQPIPGPVALQVGVGPDLVFLGSVVDVGGGHLGISARDLAARNATGGVFVVPAWIVASGLAPCPYAPPSPMATSELGLPQPGFGCVPWNWLIDDPTQPPASIGFVVQSGAYQTFGGGDVVVSGGMTTLRRGTFLVRDWGGRGEVLASLTTLRIPSASDASESSAPTPGTPAESQATEPSASPAGSPAGMSGGSVAWTKDAVVRRVAAGEVRSGVVIVTDLAEGDLSPFVADSGAKCTADLCPRWVLRSGIANVTIVVSANGEQPSTHAGRLAFMVDDRAVRLLGPAGTAPDGTPFEAPAAASTPDEFVAVHGWLRDGLPIPCPRPIAPATPAVGLDGETLSFTCPGTWIQPTSADPQITFPDGSGVVGMPTGSILVQDGADGSDQSAREGIFLVRRVPIRGCPPDAPCPSAAGTRRTDSGRWQVIGEFEIGG